MTPHHIYLVQMTWKNVIPIASTAATLFYDRLFDLDPSLRPLFSSDLEEQKKKLMRMIGIAVNSLGNLDALVPIVQDLGRRHTGYGVRDAHYDTVGAALLWTLEQGLGPAFDEEVKQAWTETYVLLATTMKHAAAEEVPVN